MSSLKIALISKVTLIRNVHKNRLNIKNIITRDIPLLLRRKRGMILISTSEFASNNKKYGL